MIEDFYDENTNMKYEIAAELGLLDKVIEHGFKNLTAKESGQIGGIIAKRRREQNSKL